MLGIFISTTQGAQGTHLGLTTFTRFKGLLPTSQLDLSALIQNNLHVLKRVGQPFNLKIINFLLKYYKFYLKLPFTYGTLNWGLNKFSYCLLITVT